MYFEKIKSLKHHTQLRYNDQIYSVNDNVAVCALNNDVYSAKLVQILNIQDPSGTYIPLIKV